MATPSIRRRRRIAIRIAIATAVIVAARHLNSRKAGEPDPPTEETFEPPKYIASLIAVVNDGAKSAQTGALAFSLVGLYLLGTAFSTTDEDLLLQHTMPVSQIGVQMPVVFSFAIAPLVLLFLHAYTLIRYDMLAANLRQLRSDLQRLVPLEADRERCRQLLANVEFVQMRTAPRGSPLRSMLYRLVAWLVLAGFPVATLLAIQISALRYQSDAINTIQQVSIAFDLALLLWFFLRHRYRRRRGELPGDPFRLGWAWFSLACLPLVLILILDALYLNVPSASTATVRQGDDGPKWREAYQQPFDLVLCPTLQWGCRYLTVDHRTLVGHVWRQEAVADLRAGTDEPHGILGALFGKKVSVRDSLAAIEGVVLRARSLRFAKFNDSRLYAADMIDADLRQATFSRAQLQGANLFEAHLDGANLFEAHLDGANLSEAHLNGADLYRAHLESTLLDEAHLERAHLDEAHLDGANLSSAHVERAHLNKAHLERAILNEAHLDGAYLSSAHLDGAILGETYLDRAYLSSAHFDRAHLNKADLNKAHLDGARLFEAHLDRADFTGAEGLTQAQLDQAFGDAETKLPEGLTRPKHWGAPARGAAPPAQ
jgi:uncharacterized protein YjbI with pentapeptide repeats